MTFEQAVAYCESLHSRGIRPGLARMEEAMHLAGDPHKTLRVIHVAGTNGKGSTVRMIQSMLTAAGYRTGVFSSPAVTGVCDTISVDGEAIKPATFAALVEKWAARQTGLEEAMSEFELLTALALDWFAGERVDICVLECGMGGGQAATNICPPPLVAVLTPIALDHTAFLGYSIEAIAAEKCGILKPPCAVVTSPAQSPEALSVIFETAAARGLTVCQPCRGATAVLTRRAGEVRFLYDEQTYTVPMGGDFQVDNALTALETVRQLAMRGFLVDEKAKVEGLSVAALPLRQEVVCRRPLRLLDAAHNPHGIAALCDTLRQELNGASLTVVFGMLKDKDTAACVALLAPLVTRAICCTPPNERALPAAALAAQFSAAGVPEVYSVEDPVDAWQEACRLAGDGVLLAGGSFYTAGAIRPYATALVKKEQN